MSAGANTNRIVSCNCTGACLPRSRGGQGYCSTLGSRPIPAPVCNLCQEPWAAGHNCTAEPAPATVNWSDRMRGCPCRVENGGSGVCGCVLSGPQVTC